MGHWALGIGHWALGIGHGELGFAVPERSRRAVQVPHAHFPQYNPSQENKFSHQEYVRLPTLSFILLRMS